MKIYEHGSNSNMYKIYKQVKINQCSTIIFFIILCLFNTSCQWMNRKEEKREFGQQQKIVGGHYKKGKAVFNFDKSAVGILPDGWSSAKTGKGGLGKWIILKDDSAPSKPNVLAQMSKKNLGYHFSIVIIDETQFADVEIEVNFKAVDGQEDQGGGLVWRYANADNYYICRANPIENNFRVYKVVDGDRRQLQSVKLTIPSNQWHNMKIENRGNHIQCWLNDILYLNVNDDTFSKGKIGLWTKADAVTYFDDIEVKPEMQ